LAIVAASVSFANIAIVETAFIQYFIKSFSSGLLKPRQYVTTCYSIFCLNLITTTEATSQTAIDKKSVVSCEVSVPVNPVTVSQTMILDISPRHPPINRSHAIIDARGLNICDISHLLLVM